MLIAAHWGPETKKSIQEGSMLYWMRLLRRPENIYHRKKAVTVKFNACDELFTHVFDAHVLAAYAHQVGINDWDALIRHVQTRNWRKVIHSIQKQYWDPEMILKWRDEDYRDVMHENAVLYLQHGWIYRTFSDALDSGDIGTVEECLMFITQWFHGTKKVNYTYESLHIISCFSRLWSPELREHYRNNCLLNISGKARGFEPIDKINEYLVREFQDVIHHNGTPATNKLAREVNARILMLQKTVRDNVYQSSGATYSSNHSTRVNALKCVKTVFQKLVAWDVFKRNPDRDTTGRSERLPSTDLYGLGIIPMCTGKGISDYINRTEKTARWRCFAGLADEGINTFEFEAGVEADEILFSEDDEGWESEEDLDFGICNEEA
jgi:hypothetical protein